MTENLNIERATIAGTSLSVSRVGLGTWAIGGWMWGGTDEAELIRTIYAAVERGINLIDTAPAYGFGRSEEIVGRAIAESGLRSQVVIATKTGLEWRGRRGLSQCQPRPHSARGRGFAAPAAHRLHRHLSGSLARPAGADRRDCRGDAVAVRPGKDPRHRRQQFLGCSDRTVSPRLRQLHVVQPPYNLVRARDRDRAFAVLPAIGSGNLDLWRAVPRSVVRQIARRRAFLWATIYD